MKLKKLKRAERIKRIAPSLSIEKILNISEKEAKLLHEPNAKDYKLWFSTQNICIPNVLWETTTGNIYWEGDVTP